MPDDEVTIKIAADVSTATAGIELLVDGMGDLIKGLTDVIKSSEDIGKSVKDLGESFEGFSKQVEANTKELIASREAAAALAKEQSEAAKAKDEADKAAEAANKKLLAAEKERLAAQKEAEKEAKKQAAAVQALAQAYGMQLSKAFDTVTNAVKDTIKAFPAMIAHVAEVGDEMATLSARIGVSVEDLSELKYMAGQSGADMTGLARTVQSLSGIFAETGEKGQKLRDSLKGIGLSVDDLKKQDPKTAFLDIVKAIQSTVPAADQGRVAMEIFGSKFRSNTMILKEDIGALQEKFKELGGGMTTELAKAGDEYSDNLKNIQQVQENFKNQIASAVLPAVNSLLEAFPKLGGLALSLGGGIFDLGKTLIPLVAQLMAARAAFMQTAAAAMTTAAAEDVATVSTSALNVALKLLIGPVGWILGALSLLGAAWFVFSNSQSDSENAIQGNVKAFKDETNAIEDALDTYDKLHGKLKLSTEETAKLDAATLLLAKASGLSADAFKKESEAADIALRVQRELLASKKELLFAAIEDARHKMEAAAQAAAAAEAEKNRILREKAPKESVGLMGEAVGGFTDIQVVNALREQQVVVDGLTATYQKLKHEWEVMAGLEPVTPKQEKGLSGLEQHIKDVDDAYKNMIATQKEAVDAGLAHHFSAQRIAQDLLGDTDAAKTLAEAIDLYKDRLAEARREAEKSAFGKLSKEAGELAKALTEAYQQGQSNRDVWDTFAKSAEKVWQEARKIPGALESLPAIVKEVALSSSWDQLEKSILKVTNASQQAAQKLLEGTGIKLEPSKMLAPAIAEDGTIRWVSQDTYKELGDMMKAQQQRVIEESMVGAAKITALREMEWQKQKEGYVKAGKDAKEIELLRVEFAKETNAQILKGDTETIEGRKRLAKSLLDQYEQMSKTQNLNDQTRIAMLQRIVQAETAAGIAGSKAAKELIALNLKVAEAALKRVEAAVLAGTADAHAYEEAKKNLEALQLASEQNGNARRKMEADFEKERLDRMIAAARANGEFTAQEIENQKKATDAAVAGSHTTITAISGTIGAVAQLATAFSQMGLASDGAFAAIAEGAGIAQQALVMAANNDKGTFGDMKKSLSSAKKDWKAFAGSAIETAAIVVNGVQDMKKATDTLSTKKNVIGGAMSGAKTGMMIAGPWGALVGAGVGAVVGALRNKGAIRAAKQAATDFGAEIPIEIAKAIDKESKARFGGDRLGAELLHMGDILKAAGGITDQNVKQMQARVMDSFNLMHAGKLTATETTKVLEESFGSFAKHVLESGKVADRGFINMINGAKTMGIQTKEMADFVLSQVDRLGKAFAGMVAPLAKSSTDIAKQVADQKKILDDTKAKVKDDNAESQKALDNESAKYDLLIAKQKQMAEDSLPAINRAARLLTASFNAAVESGASMTDAVDLLGPGLDSLIQSTKDLGINVAETSVGWLASFRDRVNANRDLIESAGSLNEIMLAMSNIGALNADTFKDLEDQGNETYDALIAKGFEQNEALTQMKPFLEQVRNAHKELKLPIDENTAALIDQAEKAGILGKEQKSTNDVLMEGFSAIIEAVGGKLPDAFKKYKDAALEASQKAAGGMKNVEGASTNVQGSLASTDWEGWSADAVAAAGEAQAAVDSVSFGSSPGGIKEIPLQLNKAMKSFKDFAKIGKDSADAVKKSVDSIQPTAGDSTTEVLKSVAETMQPAAEAVQTMADSIEAVKSLQIGAGLGEEDARKAARDLDRYQQEAEYARQQQQLQPQQNIEISIDRPLLKDRESIQDLAIEVSKQLKRAVAPTGAWS